MSEPETDHDVEQLRKQHAAALEATAKAVAMLSDTYRERAFLVALLAAEYPSVWAPDPSAGPDWRVVYVDLPTGQASWHISPDDWDLFGFVPQGDIEIWDGHTTVEKYKRVFDLTMNIHLRKMTAEQPQDDGDVRAVRAVVDAAGKLPIPQYEAMPELASALNALLERFEDRIKVIDEAESLARLRARMAADNGNRTPLAEVLRVHGMTEADLDARDANGGEGR